MSDATTFLAQIEPRLRFLLPADLYAHAWVDPDPTTLQSVFQHLRTLQRILQGYLPRQLCEHPPRPGQIRYEWQEGTLMFTDLAGFTPLMDANALQGRAGAETLLQILNRYFTQILEIISKAGGNLLEFTGDAMLIQFAAHPRRWDIDCAIRAGLRMQRAMDQFAQITTAHGSFSLQMRVGIHTGRFLRADIGTPRRMEHVLLGGVVQRTKQAEGAGRVGRVCLTPEVAQLAADRFRYEPGQEGHVLVIDDLTPTDLGEYEVAIMQRRSAGPLLIDLSSQSVMAEIERALTAVEPLASYLPQPVLQMLIESAAHRRIPPDFPEPTVMFIHLIGLVEAVDHAPVGSETVVVGMFSRVLALINAAIEAQGGVLKKITCHRYGYDMTIYFGVPNAHTNDPMRAAHAALAIRRLIMELAPVTFAAQPFTLICKIGLSQGPTFAAEIGEPRGRREFNVLGSTVNIAARLMEKAAANQILMTESVYQAIPEEFQVQALGLWMLKGKQQPVPVFSLQGSEQGGSAENLSIGLC